MFWIFILAAGLAAAFVKLGAYSAWVTVLATALKLAVLVIIGLAAALVWHRIGRRRDRP